MSAVSKALEKMILEAAELDKEDLGSKSLTDLGFASADFKSLSEELHKMFPVLNNRKLQVWDRKTPVRDLLEQLRKETDDIK